MSGLAMLRRRFRRWLENRLPRSDSWQLSQRNLYILPTRSGWGFALTLLVMLLASINYQLNLGYALTFLLGGAALVSMHQTHANLRRLALRLRLPQPVFAGEPATLEIVIDNPGRERHGVGLAVYHRPLAAEPSRKPARALAQCDVPALGSSLVHLQVATPQRGRHAVPTLRIETHFPLGLFRAWSVWRPAAELLVYPAPERPAPPLPAADTGVEGHQTLPTQAGGGGEFDGVRPWRRGDPLRQVVWKKVARSGSLVSRDTRRSASQTLTLDWQQCGAGSQGRHAPAALPQAGRGAAAATPAPHPDTEGRLARLAAWVLAAERQGLPYALRLPGVALPRAVGDGQRRAALEALALWPATGSPDPATPPRPSGPSRHPATP
ncbi:DUF58 domain-containing protein [Aquabacterium sp. OR-4]|uniref:DUF58 domain-containing protein n=1 Tax=Aquabacterium sp. OR-4 TaxID=2978127 RepID=UPI0028C6A809|nr:DUF58 domain-containing protein [Aquabacterium sp. OR-4]MDT7836825.1 DUF58 domain-containing protein [Aquabacterium sp. OR-4]